MQPNCRCFDDCQIWVRSQLSGTLEEYCGVSNSFGCSALAKRKTLLLPQRRGDEGKLTVVLDMDETLIHSEFMGPVDYRQAEERLHVSGKRPPDFIIKLYENSPDQEEEIVHVYKRPGLDNFLRRLRYFLGVVLWAVS